jgi:hypothetical protein
MHCQDKKADLLTRYFETCNWGDWVAPLLPVITQLDPLHHELPSISIANDDQWVC